MSITLNTMEYRSVSLNPFPSWSAVATGSAIMYANTSGGTIFVPIGTWPGLYRFDEPQEAVLRADSTDEMTTVGQRAADILTNEQIVSSDSDLSYRSEDLMKQAEQLQEISNSTNRQLLWIASISLLVGGIGVMNIMLLPNSIILPVGALLRATDGRGEATFRLYQAARLEKVGDAFEDMYIVSERME